MSLRPLAKLKEKRKNQEDEPVEDEVEEQDEQEDVEEKKEVEKPKESIKEVFVVDTEQIPQQEIRAIKTKTGQGELLTPNEALTEILSGIRKIVTEMEQD